MIGLRMRVPIAPYQIASKSRSVKVIFWGLFVEILQHGRTCLEQVSKACENGAPRCPKGDHHEFSKGAQAVAKGAPRVAKEAHSVPKVCKEGIFV